MTRPTGRRATAWRPVVILALAAACDGPPPGKAVPAAAPAPAAAAPAQPAAPPPPAKPQTEWAARTDALLASMPEPSAAGAFTFEGDIDHGGPERGSFKIVVSAGEREGRPAWHVVQDVNEPAFPNGMAASSEHREMWLARDLRVLAATATVTTEGHPPVTLNEPPGRRVLSLAAAILYFRTCPAEVTAGADPTPFPEVASVEADGSIHGAADTADAYRAIITLRGRERTPVEVERFLGWHNMGKLVARSVPK